MLDAGRRGVPNACLWASGTQWAPGTPGCHGVQLVVAECAEAEYPSTGCLAESAPLCSFVPAWLVPLCPWLLKTLPE